MPARTWAYHPAASIIEHTARVLNSIDVLSICLLSTDSVDTVLGHDSETRMILPCGSSLICKRKVDHTCQRMRRTYLAAASCTIWYRTSYFDTLLWPQCVASGRDSGRVTGYDFGMYHHQRPAFPALEILTTRLFITKQERDLILGHGGAIIEGCRVSL